MYPRYFVFLDNRPVDRLFGQALDEAVPETWTTLDPDQLSRLRDKFAELIVRECIDQVEVFNARMDAGPRHIVEAIKQHFGVGR